MQSFKGQHLKHSAITNIAPQLLFVIVILPTLKLK